MEVLTVLERMRRKKAPVALAAGFFDGVHRGHQKVILKTVEAARALGGEAWVLTFDTHPTKVLRPGSAPLLLTSNEHKLRLLQALGVDGCLLVPFTLSLAELRPEAFVSTLLESIPSLKEIMVGRDWRFGRNQTGDAAFLSTLAQRQGIRATAVSPVQRKGHVVSSTRIRAEIADGNLDEAAAMLGRPFDILGTVTRGRNLGRALGFPTANIDPHNEVIPPLGVYAAYALLEDGSVEKGVTNVGVRPTISLPGDGGPVVEVHLIDFDRHLYGETMEVCFVARIRDERRFADAGKLSARIAEDVLEARRILVRRKRPIIPFAQLPRA
ncbi:MAG: bifunctional riboflavin kinase/FAD synthetase [Lentisphaerae bacterium]|nr:bifunctional riboflavin kinase/FAD synthetase [Lentisphaerota bacterium]